MSTEEVRTQAPFTALHPNALAVWCSDGRFTRAVEELLRTLGHERLDTLTLPGGPALLNLLTANFTDFDATERAAGFLIRGHHIVTVTLIAHEQCGYYRARYPTRSAEQLFEQQVKDLSAAARTLRTGRPELEVHAYFARPHGNRVHFLSIEV